MLGRLRDSVLSSVFVKNSIFLSVGTAVSQAIPILLAPVIARLFTPAEFGLLAVVQSVTSIVSVVSTGKYEMAILLGRTRREVAHVVVLSLLLSLLTSLLALVVFLFFADTLALMLKQPKLAHWVFICPVISFLISIYTCYNEWCVRFSQFKQLAANKIINTASLSGANVGLGMAFPAISGGLVLGELTGRVISAGLALYNMLRQGMVYFFSTSWQHIRRVALRHRDCPAFIMPGQLINTIAGQAVVLLISYYFGDERLGLFSMANMMLAVPSSVVSVSIRDVFRQKANEEFVKNGNALELYKKTVRALFLIVLVGLLLIYFFLPMLFTFFLGQQWYEAGVYAQILSLSVLFSFVAESVSGMFLIANRMRWSFYWQLLFLGLTVLSLGLGHALFADMKQVLYCYVAARCLAYGINLLLTYRFAKGK